MYNMFTVVSALHSGPVPKQFHHLKGPWARWLSPPTSSPDAALLLPVHSSCPSAERLGTGGDGAEKGLSSMPPSTVARLTSQPRVSEQIRAMLHQGPPAPALDKVMLQMLTLAQTTGQSEEGDGESTLAHSSSPCGGQRARHGISTNQQLTILQTIIHDAG